MSDVRDRAAETLAELLRLPVDAVDAGGSPLDLPGFDSVVAVELLERRGELVHQVVGERVQRLRPVEQDDGDRVVTLEPD